MLSSTLSSHCTSTKEGLRSITSQIKDLLSTKNSFTYQTIVKSVSAQNSNTLKRRVYDVLSVMRALNLVEKCGKEYFAVDQKKNINRRLNIKKNKLDELTALTSGLKELIDRNSSKQDDVDKLYMPFIVVYTDKSTKVDCEITEEGDFFKITSKERIEILNDLDVVRMLYLENMEVGSVERNEKLFQDELNDLFDSSS